ncbi:thiolase C-terminal domain-containing protein [Halioxenophilus sp. WMMB6]|uniref:thiolase C-terminal domain-containing protein n=1 Tax=Halioxenophilus sp. WMMB6 TaxID=3073815 RepID=UPI00295EA2BB|nr:beta-ketoacyl synthase N-terminal-like domain-containing protein [Halioxenophilus sp. WMMB6]
MEDVYIIGAGQLPVGKYPESSPAALGSEAVKKALNDSGLDPSDIGALYVGNMMSGMISNQQLISTLIANEAGLTGCEVMTIEGACASGAASVRLAILAVASKQYNAVVACGAEQMTHRTHAEVTEVLKTGSHWPTEGSRGKTFISLNAELMQHYMDTYQKGHDEFASFAMSSHANGLRNPNAMLRKPLDLDTYKAGRELVAPITLFDAPPICDGAAAVVVANKDVAMAAKAMGRPIVQVRASSAATDNLALTLRESILELKASKVSAQRAYAQAQVQPKDIDMIELHDAYTIMNALSLEAMGFADPGTGTDMAKNGDIYLDGKLPICTFGGLKSRGHPVGATGCYQVVECFLQLTDNAGENQVQNANVALSQSFGGAASAVYTHIFARA